MRDHHLGILDELDPLDHRLVDPERTPPQADITHAVLLCIWSLFIDSSETYAGKRRPTPPHQVVDREVSGRLDRRKA